MEIIDTHQKPVSTTDWFGTIFITAIPLIGLIMLFVWGFGNNTKPSKANWARATLLWLLVGFVIYGFIALVFGAAILGTLMN